MLKPHHTLVNSLVKSLVESLFKPLVKPLALIVLTLFTQLMLFTPLGGWILMSSSMSHAQTSESNATLIAHNLKRLGRVGSVLYLAAHPDDENTRFIAWSARGEGLDTAYLSLTRGGGGQNLIGDELSQLLGYVRTQELLAARAIDGGRQFFTRAVDFGYSKSAKEAEETWGREHILRDIVRVIRKFMPDIIVCRFSPTGKSHGHHTASARLTLEAVKLAVDPEYDRASLLAPWRVMRVLENKPHWRIKPDTDTSAYVSLDVGGYDPWWGLSYGEIAGASRSMHKSQGFGAARRKTQITEYFGVLAGAPIKTDIFDGLELSWARFKDVQKIKEIKEVTSLITSLQQGFDPAHPERLLPDLIALDRALVKLPAHTEPYRTRKREVVRALVQASLGLWLDAGASRAQVVPGGELEVTLSALTRLPAQVTLKSIRVDHIDPSNLGELSGMSAQLKQSKLFTRKITIKLPSSASPTTPYWLAQPTRGALYHHDPRFEGAPIEPPPLHAHFELEVLGHSITHKVPVMHRWVDQTAGERSQRVQVEPPVTITPKRDAQLLKLPSSTRVEWVVEAGPRAVTVDVLLALPTPIKHTSTSHPACSVTPKQHTLSLRAHQEVTIGFEIQCADVTPPMNLTPRLRVGEREIPSLARYLIDYPHLPKRRVMLPSTMKVTPLWLKIAEASPHRVGHRVGYIVGAGDRVPDALRQMGYAVTELEGVALDQARFEDFDTVIFGIRAFNVNQRIPANHKRLMAWVHTGGRVLAQYNTNNRWRKLEQPVGPFPLTIGKARVTNESAVMTPEVAPDHPVLNVPNVLTPADYQGWVQERGLYFAVDWDERYTPVFSMSDTMSDEVSGEREAPLRGSTLITRYGEGAFVYTGLSFFRQLPAGVPGAYRLFANLLSL